jgi:hypothetical protein
MPSVEFEPTMERAKSIHALDRAAIVIGSLPWVNKLNARRYRGRKLCYFRTAFHENPFTLSDAVSRVRQMGELRAQNVDICGLIELPHPVRELALPSEWISPQASKKAIKPSLGSEQTLKPKLNSVAWVRERTVPIERPPLVDEVSAKFADRCRDIYTEISNWYLLFQFSYCYLAFMPRISPSELYVPHIITSLRILTMFGEEWNLQLPTLLAFSRLNATCSPWPKYCCKHHLGFHYKTLPFRRNAIGNLSWSVRFRSITDWRPCLCFSSCWHHSRACIYGNSNR